MTKRDYKRPKERGQKHMPLFLTKEIIIKRFRKKHGDRYDYSLVEFKGCDSYVSIICKEHGVFNQRADGHAEGKNCPKCVKRHKPTTREFIESCLNIFGDQFDYSKTEYINTRTKIAVTCKDHGDFEIGPFNHKKSKFGGCPECAPNKKHDVQSFIKKAISIHGDKYSYIHIDDLKNTRAKIKIECKEHGIFIQIADQHIHGRGCPKCAMVEIKAKTSLGLDEFIRLANQIHDHKYDYSKVKYINGYTKVKIICPAHGIFEQRPHGHLQTRGCKECGNESKFNFQRSAYIEHCDKVSKGLSNLYVILCRNNEEAFYKIGITLHSVEKRYKGVMPYKYKKVKLIRGNASFVWDLEKRLHGMLKEYACKPQIKFAGDTECFSQLTKDVEKLLDNFDSTNQMQLIA